MSYRITVSNPAPILRASSGLSAPSRWNLIRTSGPRGSISSTLMRGSGGVLPAESAPAAPSKAKARKDGRKSLRTRIRKGFYGGGSRWLGAARRGQTGGGALRLLLARAGQGGEDGPGGLYVEGVDRLSGWYSPV